MSDQTNTIWDGCFYRNEGANTKDILCSAPGSGEVPGTVTGYEYDDNFLIASQKPKIPGESLYSKTYEYDDSEAEYYWIVIRSPRAFVGPLTADQYVEMREQYGVPDDLTL